MVGSQNNQQIIMKHGVFAPILGGRGLRNGTYGCDQDYKGEKLNVRETLISSCCSQILFVAAEHRYGNEWNLFEMIIVAMEMWLVSMVG